jgi:hypothetical protein
MNWVVAGRNISEACVTKVASAVVAKTGAEPIVGVLIPT